MCVRNVWTIFQVAAQESTIPRYATDITPTSHQLFMQNSRNMLGKYKYSKL